MKRYFLLLALSIAVARAEEAKLPKNVIMRIEKGMMSVKAGTAVEVIKRDAKAITVKVNGKVGTIPLDSFTAPAPEKVATTPAVPEPTPAAKPTAAPTVKPTANPTSHGATSNYGKMMERAQAAVAAHEKANSTDEGLLENRK